MSTTHVPARLNTGDRAGLGGFFSLLVHMVILLGVSFVMPDLREIQGLPTLEVTLVEMRTETAPDEADFLAQFHQLGGGDTVEDEIARTPLPVRELSEQNSDIPTLPQLPQTRLARSEQVTTVMSGDDRYTVQQRTRKDMRTQPEQARREIGFLEQLAPQEERTRQQAEISRRWQEQQKQPRHKYLNARTREYKYAEYVAAWEAKVERIGNATYPEKIRRLGLSGSVVLDVAVRANGAIHSIDIVESSGNALLDEAAIRAARQAAPFQPFPADIRAETDVLHMTRTWEFNLARRAGG